MASIAAASSTCPCTSYNVRFGRFDRSLRLAVTPAPGTWAGQRGQRLDVRVERGHAGVLCGDGVRREADRVRIGQPADPVVRRELRRIRRDHHDGSLGEARRGPVQGGAANRASREAGPMARKSVWRSMVARADTGRNIMALPCPGWGCGQLEEYLFLSKQQLRINY
jgi:hypothetical protein